ncbi:MULTISPECIES: NfeD family protein [Gemella]|uniref:NfeD family protein n=1 Tax=Gemella TaxID=1378 RepID=UPI00076810EA|nr:MULTISPECIES: NfeD family protein [Gemella]AME09258.1 serine peptidase [Gemella sp. oral taxon 928]
MENMYLYLDWILLILMSLTFCQQLFSKKFNLYGIISILSLAVYIALHSYNTDINIFVLVMFLSGIALVVLEMFVPGGIIGTIGIITLISAIIYINNATYSVTFIMVIAIILFIGLYIFNRHILNKKLVFLNALVLKDAITTKDGYVAMESRAELLGKSLVAYTDLRPAGTAVLNDEKFDVVTDGDFIKKGDIIEVTHVEGMRIVVRKK